MSFSLPLNFVLRAPLIARVILFTNYYDASITVRIGRYRLPGVTRFATKNDVWKEKAEKVVAFFRYLPTR